MAGGGHGAAGASAGSEMVAKAIPWVIFASILFGFVRWMGTPTVVINGTVAEPGGQITSPTISRPAEMPTAPQGKQWANNGKNPQCAGKPKFVAFTCVSPTTGRSTTCMCD